MKMKVQSIHFDADSKLLGFIQDKVDKLTNFYENIIDSEVYLRLDKAEEKANKVAEIKINTPGKTLFARKQCRTFEEATDNAIESLRRQITRHKEKKRGV
jgi:putative sigma-54 modulation protein